ncbi:MAG: hypothetical protein HKN45_01590 [Flavobacteriales bacterium]|nr:hypothetical protein [Flavobacteriales bacterium]NNK81350.1 hypothetical protein [Flavobacteriales bacterium]
MESKKIDRLAELFWKGETSEAQEMELREAILYGPESDEHEELKDYFKYAEEIKGSKTLGDLFDVQMMNEIESRSARNSSFFLFKMAAGIVILLGLFFGLRSVLDDSGSQIPLDQEMVIVDTYDDPEQAYQEVKNALMLVSKNMNQGLSYTGSLGQFDKAKGKIKKENRDDENRPNK